ncbi:MAG: hypothetical protein L0387_39620 [Acidobacteria bacterium]|nr:hypothetical protein [Acidobacteriota bacterium]
MEKELERLRKRAPAPDYLRRKRELYSKQVSDFASLLKPEVRRELEQEPSSEIAKEWLDQAKQALKFIAPELPHDLLQSKELWDATELVRKGLSEQFLQEAIKPSTNEIDSHAHELAQCVLANWFSILEHTKQDNPGKVLSLTANAMPVGVDLSATFEGVQAFVVPVKAVASKFMEYLESLREAGTVVELAPALYLAQKRGKMHLAGSEEEARRFVSTVPFIDWVLSTLRGIFGRTHKPAIAASAMDEQMERSLAVAAAYIATQKSYPSYLLADRRLDITHLILDEQHKRLSATLAEYAMLEQALHDADNLWARMRLRTAQGTAQKHLIGKVQTLVLDRSLRFAFPDSSAVGALFRTSVAATGYAVSGATEKSAAIPDDLDAVGDFIENNPQAFEIFCISAHAAEQALAKFKIQMQQLRRPGES